MSGEETLPGAQVQSDDELLDYARRNGNTCYHASCTCMMGEHAMAVVDSELRVHGLDGLRVIDASVMPAVTSTNTNAPTIMIAEKARRDDQGGGAAETGRVILKRYSWRKPGPASPSLGRLTSGSRLSPGKRFGWSWGMQADYVIVGAGSAGLRSGQPPDRRPGDAGRPDRGRAGATRNPLIHIPAGYMKLLDHKP